MCQVTIRDLPFNNIITSKDPIREGVASLSSGRYYRSPQEWYNCLSDLAAWHGLTVGDCPDFTIAMETADQRYIYLYRGEGQVGAVFVASYRMRSFNYEMICYVV